MIDDPRLPERFWNKVVPEPNTGCFIWVGPETNTGRGTVGYGGRSWLVYRLTYSVLVGPIPAGLTIDHLCRNGACCNPDHLEAVTASENRRRAACAITHCKYGHAFSDENTYRTQKQRHCKTCKLTRNRVWMRGYKKKPVDAGTVGGEG